MVTYEPTKFSSEIKVYLGRKQVGTIKPNGNAGFYYEAKGSKKYHGDTFKTVAEVKHSLEN